MIVSRASGCGPVLAPLEPLREQDSRPWLYSRGDYTAPFLHRAERMDGQLSLSNATSGVALREHRRVSAVTSTRYPTAAELLGGRFQRYPRAGASQGTERSSSPRDPAGTSLGALGGVDAPALLTAGSAGVFGLRDVSLSSTASDAAQGSVVTSTGKSVHLDQGTRLLLSSQAGASGETRGGPGAGCRETEGLQGIVCR